MDTDGVNHVVLSLRVQSLLAENMAYEAEKILIGLVCYNTDKSIKMKFIEGCLENVQKNKYDISLSRFINKFKTWTIRS